MIGPEEQQWIPGHKGETGQGYGPLPWKNHTADCPKLKDASGLSFKELVVDLRRWLRASWLTPDVRILKILEALPKHFKGIFQNIPDEVLWLQRHEYDHEPGPGSLWAEA